MNNNRLSNWTLFLYLLIAFLLGVSVAINFLPSKNKTLSNPQINKLTEVMNYIDEYYVDSVNVDTIFDNAINDILQSLDPHSAYSTPEENKSMMETLEGSFEGIGVQFNIMNDTVMVIATVSGGPSEKAGLRAGDRIVSVNGKSIAGVGIQSERVFKLLRGKKGTKVKVGIHRPGFKETYHYEITRNVIPTYSVDIAYMMNKTTGYIKINEFGSTTADEFAKAIVKLQKQGMTSMIVDLRGNPGGFLDAAVSVCDEMLPNKKKIVSIEGLKVPPEIIYATRKGHFETGKVAILIDDFSASASEIVAGAIQDNDRGIVVGRRSFGKGLVQRQFDLADKSTIRLTTARYHTPSGRCIQKTYKNGTPAYYEELYDRYEHGEMECADSIKLDKSLKYKTTGGRTVYGGGGIMPDYFVPIDHGHDLDGYYTFANSAALMQYAFNYTNDHKAALKKLYPNTQTYNQKMTVSDAQLQQLLRFYTKLTKHIPPKMTPASAKELKSYMKALIGRDLYGDYAFYPVLNSTDKVVIKALQELPKCNFK